MNAAISKLWTPALRQFAAGFYKENKKKAAMFPVVPVRDQRDMALKLGCPENYLSCPSCEGRGLLGVVAHIHSKGGRVAGSFSSVMVCPECAGAGMNWPNYNLAKSNKAFLEGAA